MLAFRGCTHTFGTGILLLALSHYIGDPDMIQSLASSPFSGHFTRLHAIDVKGQRWLHRPSVGASLGFAPTMWDDDVITHHMPSRFPFCSLQVLLLLTTQWPVRAPVKLLGGAQCRPWSFTPTQSLTGLVGQPFASHIRGSGSHPGGAPTLLELRCPVSNVLLHWWLCSDPWSLAMIVPVTWAIVCFSHPSCPSSVLSGGHRLMQHTVQLGSRKPRPVIGGGGALWSSCIFTPLQYTVSLVHWVNCLLPV